MRAIGVLLILAGIVLACVEVNYALRSATEQQSYQEKCEHHQDEVAKYYEQKTANPSARYPVYPREVKWSGDDLLLSNIAAYGGWLFLGGCALFVAGAVRAPHSELCKVLRQMTAPLSPKAKPKPQEPAAVRRPETGVSAAEALDDMARSSQSVPQTASDQKTPAESPATPSQTASGDPEAKPPPVQKQRKTRELTFWSPGSDMGALVLLVWLGAVGYAAWRGRGEAVDVIGAIILNYVVAMTIRWLAFVRPKQHR